MSKKPRACEGNPRALQFRTDPRLTRKQREDIEAHGHNSVGSFDDTSTLVRTTQVNSPPASEAEIRWDRRFMVTGRQVHCPLKDLSRDRPAILPGAALSYMARGNMRDIRPDLLMLASGVYPNAVPLQRVLRYCCEYLKTTCERAHIRLALEVRKEIVCDALRMWHSKRQPTQEERAKNLQIRKATYGVAFGIVYSMINTRYEEAIKNRIAAKLGNWDLPLIDKMESWNSELSRRQLVKRTDVVTCVAPVDCGARRNANSEHFFGVNS